MLGEPNEYAYEDTNAPGDGYHTTLDLIDFIHRGELKVVDDIGSDAIGGRLTVCDRTTVNGTNTYALPGTDPTLSEWPIERLLQVEMDAGAGYLVPVDIKGIDLFRELTQDGNIPWSVYQPIGAFLDDSTLIVNPTPGAEAGASKLRFHYRRLPRKRWRHHHGIVGAGGGPSSIVDTDQPYTLTNFYIVEGPASVRIIEGLAGSRHVGVERLVLAYDGSTKTITTTPLGGAVQVGDHYVVGELSDLSPQLSDIAMQYAFYLGLGKERDSQEKNDALSEYKNRIARYQNSRKRKQGSRPAVIGETRWGDEW